MARITWTDQMSIGVAVIDDDHKVLVNQFNRLADAVEAKRDPSAVAGVIEALIDYTAFHFEREMQLMRLTEFPGLTGHEKEHERLVHELYGLNTAWRTGGATARQVLNFVGRWLSNHILKTDLTLGKHLVSLGADQLVAPLPARETLNWEEVSVMVADDSYQFRRLLRGVLSGIGVGRVTEARNGEEALARLAAEPVDVVLADDHMPPLNGIEMTHRLRRAPGPPDPRTCVILMASEGVTRDDLREATLAGVHDLLVKPVTADMVRARLRRHLRRPLSFQQVGDALIPVRTTS